MRNETMTHAIKRVSRRWTNKIRDGIINAGRRDKQDFKDMFTVSWITQEERASRK